MACACSFGHGTGIDRTDAESEDTGSNQDADVDAPDSMMTMIDAAMMSDGPTAGVCNTAGLVCAGTTYATMCNGACWVRCTSNVAIANQPAAVTACTTWGGKLAPIRNQADHDCVVQTLFPGYAHWIGFEQASIATSVSTGWSWNSDGVTPTYFHWGSGQPNDLDANETDHAEQCAFINTAGDWHDDLCSSNGLYRFSCRR